MARTFAGVLLAALPAAAMAADSAVVLMYHRFGEPAHGSTSISLETFEAQLRFLRDGGFHVLPLTEIVDAFRAGRELPDRTVAITMDDAYRSIYLEAWPRLKAMGFPMTLFVAAGPVDEGRRGYMGWDEIREMAAGGVTVGHHTMWHRRLQRASAVRVRREIDEATARYLAELGHTPEIFAYPYGEYSLRVRQTVMEAGFKAAFAQHSGVAYAGGDRFALPRFFLNDSLGDLDRFRRVVNALPLPVTELTPRDPVLGYNPPPLGFTVDGAVTGLGGLACYASGRGPATVEVLGAKRVEVRVAEPFPPGRIRFNCTLNAGNGRWRWLGAQYLVPRP